MRVLVTGGGGFAGRHLLRTLLAESPGAWLTATVIGDAAMFSSDEALERVVWREMDLGSSASVRAVVEEVRPEAVYHLAGQASVGESLEKPLETWEVNATGTLRLLREVAALSATCRFLLISSAEVYGSGPGEGDPITEEAAIEPITPYGASKAAAEVIALQQGRSSGIRVVVARSFNHIGPGQDERFVLPSIAKQLVYQGGSRTVRVGNLDVERDFLDVRDVVRAYSTLMRVGVPGRVYNVASGEAVSLQTVVERMVELSGSGVRLEVDPDRVRRVDIPVLRGDASRLRSLGWRPQIDLDSTLRDLLDFARSTS